GHPTTSAGAHGLRAVEVARDCGITSQGRGIETRAAARCIDCPLYGLGCRLESPRKGTNRTIMMGARVKPPVGAADRVQSSRSCAPWAGPTGITKRPLGAN